MEHEIIGDRIYATMLNPSDYFANPELAMATADIDLAFSGVDPDDVEALYERAGQIADAIHEGVL